MCVEGIREIGILAVVAIDGVQNAAHNEAVPVSVPPESGSPRGLPLHAEVRRIHPGQNDNLL